VIYSAKRKATNNPLNGAFSMPEDSQRMRSEQPPPDLTDAELIAAIDHPYRAHILAVTSQRVASQAEMSKDLKVKSNVLSHHLSKLEGLGLIELVKEEFTKGGKRKGRWYRAIGKSWVEADQWKQVSPEQQPAVTAQILANCNADLRAAVLAGTIHGDDNVIARAPVAVDKEGWTELVGLLNETTREVMNIAARSAARLKPGENLTPAKVHIIHFASPGPSL
jgi:DNA-binding transcriptional ArsR family regulator